MKTYVHLVLETPVELWYLSSRERLRRALKRLGEATVLDDLGQVAAGDDVLVIRGDYLYDLRILAGLLSARDIALTAYDGKTIVAARALGRLAPGLRDLVMGKAALVDFPGLAQRSPAALCPGFDRRLLKVEQPLLLPISAENRRHLEQRLFNGAYKGVTDLVTKWVWPVPARWTTAGLARWGVRPNLVTSMSWALATAVGLLFIEGQLALGLAAAWLMTFLDTVDGKLARVTVSYTNFGDLFDHVLDLVHPPLWYAAWGVGVTAVGGTAFGFSHAATVWLIVSGYVLGRLAEGVFSTWLGGFSIFSWRPIDSYSRLVTARRNPSLILLTLGSLSGRPDVGLAAVAVWTLLSSLFLGLRLIMAWYERSTFGPLRPWLMDLDPKAQPRSLAMRWYAAC